MAKRRRRRSFRKRSREEWVAIISDYRASGLPQRRFAHSRGVSESSLGRWSRLLLAEEGAVSDALAPAGLVEIVSKEVATKAEDLSRSGGFPRLYVGSSVCLELRDWPSPEYVALVARAYEAVAPC